MPIKLGNIKNCYIMSVYEGCNVAFIIFCFVLFIADNNPRFLHFHIHGSFLCLLITVQLCVCAVFEFTE